jgi:ubiquitin carboxyl-terminal hydrolase L3
LERAEILSTTPLFAKIHTESASSNLNQTAPNLDTELHFTCFVEAPEAEFRRIARDSDGKNAEDLEKEREEMARQSGTGMRLIELDGRRDGPIDHGECKDFLKVSRYPVSLEPLLGDSLILIT